MGIQTRSQWRWQSDVERKREKDFEVVLQCAAGWLFSFHAKRRIYRCGAWRAWQYRGTSDGDTVQVTGRTAPPGNCDRTGGTGRAEFGGCQGCYGEAEKETGSSAKGNQGSKDHCADGAGYWGNGQEKCPHRKCLAHAGSVRYTQTLCGQRHYCQCWQ